MINLFEFDTLFDVNTFNTHIAIRILYKIII